MVTELRAEDIRRSLISTIPKDMKEDIFKEIIKGRENRKKGVKVRVYDPNNVVTAPIRQWLYDLGYKTKSYTHYNLKREYDYTEIIIDWYTYEEE